MHFTLTFVTGLLACCLAYPAMASHTHACDMADLSFRLIREEMLGDALDSGYVRPIPELPDVMRLGCSGASVADMGDFRITLSEELLELRIKLLEELLEQAKKSAKPRLKPKAKARCHSKRSSRCCR